MVLIGPWRLSGWGEFNAEKQRAQRVAEIFTTEDRESTERIVSDRIYRIVGIF